MTDYIPDDWPEAEGELPPSLEYLLGRFIQAIQGAERACALSTRRLCTCQIHSAIDVLRSGRNIVPSADWMSVSGLIGLYMLPACQSETATMFGNVRLPLYLAALFRLVYDGA